MRLRVAPDDLAVALLAFASGTSDVLSFLALGGTFTSAMTGNTALLGLSLGQGRLAAAERAFAALIGFLCGGVAGTLCREHAGRQRALLRILALEAVCLGLFTAVWAGAADVENRWVLFPLILLSATGMGAQSVAARHINLPGLPTVVFTSTLTSIVMAATEMVFHGTPFSVDAVRQCAVFGAYLAGALLAGIVATHSLGAVVLLPLAAVLIALVAELHSRS